MARNKRVPGSAFIMYLRPVSRNFERSNGVRVCKCFYYGVGLIYATKNISRNTFVPNHLLSGRVRKSETKFHPDSFIFNYLDFL